jgi:hypothetical protein
MRQLEDWLDGYIAFTKNTESAAVFHKWVGISMIASALRRKVHFRFGRIRVHPNLFIVLVAEPGIARKTQAINFGEDILAEITGITMSADAITPQALLEDLELAADDALMPDNTQFRHSSLSIVSGEFESFLGQRKENSKMIITLTDLFDCKARPFRYRTKHSGTNTVPHPFLNLMAATTPESLAQSLPSSAIGGGLTTRMIFIWADDKEQKIDVPEYSKAMAELRTKLVQDLSVIARITGSYGFDKASREWWADFYEGYNERDPYRICKDPAFNGWYSRKPMFMVKIGMILAACQSQERTVRIVDFERALALLEEAEALMGKTFVAVGRSEITADVDLVRNLVERHGAIAEKKLLHMVWRDVDSKKFDNVMATLIRSGDVERKYKSPDGAQEIWYHWAGS